MSCLKHFALYGGAEAGRDYNTVDMSRIKMYEYYLPPYRAAVAAGAGSVMTSFNEINGIPSSGNQWLLTRFTYVINGILLDLLSQIIHAVNEMIAHGLGNLQEVSARCDSMLVSILDMVSEGFLTTLNQSVQEGKVTEETIRSSMSSCS